MILSDVIFMASALKQARKHRKTSEPTTTQLEG